MYKEKFNYVALFFRIVIILTILNVGCTPPKLEPTQAAVTQIAVTQIAVTQIAVTQIAVTQIAVTQIATPFPVVVQVGINTPNLSPTNTPLPSEDLSGVLGVRADIAYGCIGNNQFKPNITIQPYNGIPPYTIPGFGSSVEKLSFLGEFCKTYDITIQSSDVPPLINTIEISLTCDPESVCSKTFPALVLGKVGIAGDTGNTGTGNTGTGNTGTGNTGTGNTGTGNTGTGNTGTGDTGTGGTGDTGTGDTGKDGNHGNPDKPKDVTKCSETKPNDKLPGVCQK